MSKREQKVVVNLFLSVYAPALILSVCRGLLLPVLPLFARSFEVSYSLVGVVLAADGIGTLLGENGINIGTFNLGRREAGGEAVLLLSLDDEAPADVIDQADKVEGVKLVKALSF